MSDDVIEELWLGNIAPQENYLKNCKGYEQLAVKVENSFDALAKSLTDKQKELLDEFDEANAEFGCLKQLEAFRYGMKLGMKMMIDTGLKS